MNELYFESADIVDTKDRYVISNYINTARNGKYTIEKTNYKYEKYDLVFYDDKSYNFCEIKGRKITTKDYNAMIIDRKKVDYLIERVQIERKYNKYRKTNAFIFWIHYLDNIVVYCNVEDFVKYAIKTTLKTPKSMENGTLEQDELYLYRNMFLDLDNLVLNKGLYMFKF